METKEKKILGLSILGVLVMITLISSITYAWFSTTIEGDNTEIKVTTALLGPIIYTGTELTANDILPGWVSEDLTLTVEGEVTGNDAVGYYCEIANNGSITDIEYRVGADGEATSESGTWTSVQINPIVTGSISSTNASDVYKIGISFKETGLDQNSQQGKELKVSISCNIIRGATAPVITGGSEDWTTETKTITISEAGTSEFGIDKYEYYLTNNANEVPNISTQATGDFTELTIDEEGEHYIFVRTVASNGLLSDWSERQAVKIDRTEPTITLTTETSVTKGDSFALVTDYTTGNISGSEYTCTSNLDGEVTNTSELTTTGTHEITCTVTTGAGLSKTETTTIKITYQAYSIKNIVVNGSFENGINGWAITAGQANVSTDYMNSTSACYTAAHGNYNLYFNSTTTSITTQATSAPILNHQYYGRLLHLTPGDFSAGDSGLELYYNDATGGKMSFLKKRTPSQCWTLLSGIQKITTNTYLSNNWVIRNFYTNMSPYGYTDDLMIIDLTATFGAGNEPNKAWCDKHIKYFDGTTTIYK